MRRAGYGDGHRKPALKKAGWSSGSSGVRQAGRKVQFKMRKIGMSDKFLSTITGLASSLLAMITGLINVGTLIEVAIYGVVGGAAGLVGKWIVSICKYHLEKRFKK